MLRLRRCWTTRQRTYGILLYEERAKRVTVRNETVFALRFVSNNKRIVLVLVRRRLAGRRDCFSSPLYYSFLYLEAHLHFCPLHAR